VCAAGYSRPSAVRRGAAGHRSGHDRDESCADHSFPRGHGCVLDGPGQRRPFPYRLEANIFPHLVVYQNFSDILDIEEQMRRGVTRVRERAISISGTPSVRIRMLRETSAPVRTPSYMPRGNVQLILVRGLNDPIRGRPTAALTSAASRQMLESVARVSGVLRRKEAHQGAG
jgi:hypothetical protein